MPKGVLSLPETRPFSDRNFLDAFEKPVSGGKPSATVGVRTVGLWWRSAMFTCRRNSRWKARCSVAPSGSLDGSKSFVERRSMTIPGGATGILSSKKTARGRWLCRENCSCPPTWTKCCWSRKEAPRWTGLRCGGWGEKVRWLSPKSSEVDGLTPTEWEALCSRARASWQNRFFFREEFRERTARSRSGVSGRPRSARCTRRWPTGR